MPLINNKYTKISLVIIGYRNLFALVLLSTLLVLNSYCSKNKNTNTPSNPSYYRFTLDTVKSWILFKPGTLWIYKNINDNQMDTLIVSDFSYDSIEIKGTADYAKNTTIKYDILYYKAHSSQGYTKEYFSNDYNANLTPSMIKWGCLLSCKTTSGANSTSEATLKFPFIPGDGSYGINDAHMENIQDTLTVSGITYKNVLIVNNNRDFSWAPPEIHTSRYYWAKNVGVVRKEITDKGIRIDLVYKTINQ